MKALPNMNGDNGNGDKHNDQQDHTEKALAEESCSSAESKIPERVNALVQQAESLRNTASALNARLKSEELAVSQQALTLERDMQRLKFDVISAAEREVITPQLADKLEEEIERAHWMIYEGDVGALLPHKYNGIFLRLLLGPVNVKASQKDVRFKVKEEYNAYRDRTAILFLLFPSILLLSKRSFWKGCFPALPVQAYQAWLLFLYTSLAVRENILRINGSDIRAWWVYHHYCAMLMAIVSLTWDIKGNGQSCEQKQREVKFFLVWAVVQGVAMLLQNRYQRQRLYTRIALGKAGRMDVVWGETAGVVGQLWLLYPLLFVLQFFQGYLGILLLLTTFTKDDFEWQVICCGTLLLIMASGNFSHTLKTMVAKRRMKMRMKGKHQP